jgi:5-methyltetrahydropteroyltriglutamate--homocysteine methyltransferase
MSRRAKPPYRADHVGSLLRPKAVHEARAKRAKGEIDNAALKAVEDVAVEAAIKGQERVGLDAITDGELRRGAWSFDFLEELDGVEWTLAEAAPFKGAAAHQSKMLKVTGKLGFSGHPMLEHFKFLKSHTSRTPKMTIPSPTMLASVSRDWRTSVDRSVYPTLPEMFVDLGLAYRKAVRAFYDAGCRYLQLDDCSLAFVCDPQIREQVKERGDDPDTLLEDWVGLINSALADKPDDMVVTTHVCRGNFRSTWLSEGGYEPVAEALFGRIGFDGFFLEYDSDRAGGFEPLRHISKSSAQTVVLGLITSKTGDLEDKGEIERRIDQAAAYVDRDRLCISPQCGFASTEEGNALSEDQQWAKLAEVVEIAGEVWGA